MFSYFYRLAGGSIGQCATDAFSITAPGNAGSPEICGFNTGQHSMTSTIMLIKLWGMLI